MTFKRTLLTLACAFGSALSAATQSQAALIVTLPTASTAGSIVITHDINFTITSAGQATVMYFDEWVTNDGARTTVDPAKVSPASLIYSLNGGSNLTVDWNPTGAFADNTNLGYGSVTVNDGYLQWAGYSAIEVAVNDVLTIKAATYTLAAGSLPGFNPQANQTFTGNAFLGDFSGNLRSGLTPVGSVPEPSCALLLTGALIPLSLRRRRLA